MEIILPSTHHINKILESTCLSNSSATSSNKSFGVEPEVLDATAK